jgi:hypothetical protein
MQADNSHQPRDSTQGPQHKPSDVLRDELTSASLPSAPRNHTADITESGAVTRPITLERDLIVEHINSGDPKFMQLLREGLNSGDRASREVWRTICNHCDTVSQAALINLLSEAYQIQKPRLACDLALSILVEPKFSNKVELINCAVSLIRKRNLLTLPAVISRIIERGEAYGEHLPVQPRHIHRIGKNEAAEPIVIDAAGAACVELLFDYFGGLRDSDSRVAFKAWALLTAQLFAKQFPNCVNPWMGQLALHHPHTLVAWRKETVRQRSRLPTLGDLSQAAFAAAIAPGVFYVAQAVFLGGFNNAGFGLSAGLLIAGLAAVKQLHIAGYARRRLAEELLPPTQRVQLYTKADEILDKSQGHRQAAL